MQAVAATGKILVIVLMNWQCPRRELGKGPRQCHSRSLVFRGEDGGGAIAETLSGKNNPAGRLPVTFYKDVHQLPHFENYSMKGRTYRYFEGEPLWEFGYGLSYTTFGYDDSLATQLPEIRLTLLSLSRIPENRAAMRWCSFT